MNCKHGKPPYHCTPCVDEKDERIAELIAQQRRLRAFWEWSRETDKMQFNDEYREKSDDES